jgi:hypothetical protein
MELDMEPYQTLELKTYQKVISMVLIMLCVILYYTYARTSFATLTERSGYYGDLYSYYNVDRIPFGIYNFIIALLSSCIIFLQGKSLLRNDKTFFKQGNWLFLGMVILLLIVEVYLQTRFHGKG